MYGHLRGFGYCEYYYTFKGIGIDITVYAHGTIIGKSNVYGEHYGTELIAGEGEQTALGAGNAGSSQWKSLNEGEITFAGTSNSLSIGIGNGAIAKVITCTKLLYPLKLNNIGIEKDFIECCCKLKIENCCEKNE
jgi:hypothetical protein